MASARDLPDAAQLLQAIRAHCLDCSCGSRGSVKNCKVKSCKLYPFRVDAPKQKGSPRAKGANARGESTGKETSARVKRDVAHPELLEPFQPNQLNFLTLLQDSKEV